jgi:small GTP-binding protein
MSHQSDLISSDIDAYLAQHERKELLRFLTCGNVDDGKSTLIGRLLYDSKMIYEDQLAAVQSDSVKSGTTGAGKIDLALLVDGLQAEREQGITIDVAYRYFSTSTRKFIIADTPGHEQYTRNMATGASTCDLAVILIDARYGVQTQTKRHSFIASLLGLKHIVVAINKMDLVDYSKATYEKKVTAMGGKASFNSPSKVTIDLIVLVFPEGKAVILSPLWKIPEATVPQKPRKLRLGRHLKSVPHDLLKKPLLLP